MEVDGFEWDDTKADTNFLKHGVTFGEAATVFGDPLAETAYDPEHAEEEDRYLIVRLSEQNRVLVVCFTDRGERVRICSAREATGRERRGYEDGTFP